MEPIIVFDLGGTLMEYMGMPHSWISYYDACFHAVNNEYSLNLSQDDIRRSVEILKDYNPRYKPREIEFSPEFLFQEATAHWNTGLSTEDIIDAFFSGMKLTAKIYDDTIPAVLKLKEQGYKTAALTNLPSSMPDSLFRADIPQILKLLDLYVSSEICGYRKPNQAGLECIAAHFGTDIHNLIFVGDEKLDIDTARRAGCTSVLICRSGEYHDFMQNHTIRTLWELDSVLSGQSQPPQTYSKQKPQGEGSPMDTGA